MGTDTCIERHGEHSPGTEPDCEMRPAAGGWATSADTANAQQIQAATIRLLVDAGAEFASVIRAITEGDMKLLKPRNQDVAS